MKSSFTEIAAAWIVALALIAAMAVNVFLPKTPPTFERGVTALGPARPSVDVPAAAKTQDPDLPLLEFGAPFGPSPDDDKAVAEPRRRGSSSGSGSDLTPEITAGRARG